MLLLIFSEKELAIHPLLFVNAGLQRQLRVVDCLLIPLAVTFSK